MSHTLRPHLFGEYGPAIHRAEVGHRNVNETPLIIAFGLALFVFVALIWYCFSTAFRTRTKWIDASNTDPEAGYANEPSTDSDLESVPSFTNPQQQQYDPGSGEHSKELIRSTHHQIRSVTIPYPVYAPNNAIGRPGLSHLGGHQHELSHVLPNLPSLPSLYVPLYRTDAGSSITLIEHELHPPPDYSSILFTPSDPISTQPSVNDMTARFLDVGGTENGSPRVALISASFSGPDGSRLFWKPGEFPLSYSQPTMRGTSTSLTRTLSSPERSSSSPKYFDSKPFSGPFFQPPTNSDNGPTRLFGTYAILVDHQSGRGIMPRLSIPSEHITASDSVMTIRPCYGIGTAAGDLSGAECVKSHFDDNCAYNEPTSRAIATTFASDDGIVRTTTDSAQESTSAHMRQQSRESGQVEISA